MRLKNYLINEAKQVGNLYHYTSYINLVSIIKSNKINIGKTGYVSFTRNKKLHFKSTIGITGVGVQLIINGDKLSNNYKIKPYKYHNYDYNVGDESEERLFTTIKNIKKYIIKVVLFKNRFPDENKKLMILGRELLGSVDNYPSINDIFDFVKRNKIKVEIK